MRKTPALFGMLLASLCYSQSVPAFQWIKEVDASGADQFAGLATDAQGNIYIAGSTASTNFPVKNAVQNHNSSKFDQYDVFVTKLDPSGAIVYSTYFGGSNSDVAAAMTVDAAGNVYVTGTTNSNDFPTTPGSYSPSVPPGPYVSYAPFGAISFLFKLNPQGSVGFSTYFTSSPTVPYAIAVDRAGSVYLTGTTFGGLEITPGAYQSVCACGPGLPFQPLSSRPAIAGPPMSDGFVTRFDADGSKLIYSTYLGPGFVNGLAIVVASDGSAYVAGNGEAGVGLLNSTGTSLIASAKVNARTMTIAPDGSLYMAGGGDPALQLTSEAFAAQAPVVPQINGQPTPFGVGEIVRMDAKLENFLAATYFGGYYGTAINAMTVDSAGNLYVGGQTSPRSLPTAATFVQGFGFRETGFVAQLSGDLSTLLFSSDFGDNELFGVRGVGIGLNGSLVLGGSTEGGLFSPPTTYRVLQPSPGDVWVNSVTVTPPPSLRVDSVVNDASQLSDPISSGETILVRGAGFEAGAELLIGGVAVPVISMNSTRITATVPPNLPAGATSLQVRSGASASNSVTVAVAVASPGVFSVDGTGFGLGYILNQDGTLNSPSNPASRGERITIYATGVGPVSFTGGYAVTQYPSNVFVDGIYCNGVAAVMGPVAGFHGDVYQQTVYVPDMAASGPLVGLILELNGVKSQYWLGISIGQ